VNRDFYHLQMPRKGGLPKTQMPYRAERCHQFWRVDIRYLDMRRLPGVEMVYCISILENVSQSVLAEPKSHSCRKKGRMLLLLPPLWAKDA